MQLNISPRPCLRSYAQGWGDCFRVLDETSELNFNHNKQKKKVFGGYLSVNSNGDGMKNIVVSS